MIPTKPTFDSKSPASSNDIYRSVSTLRGSAALRTKSLSEKSLMAVNVTRSL